MKLKKITLFYNILILPISLIGYFTIDLPKYFITLDLAFIIFTSFAIITYKLSSLKIINFLNIVTSIITFILVIINYYYFSANILSLFLFYIQFITVPLGLILGSVNFIIIINAFLPVSLNLILNLRLICKNEAKSI